jgi:hypothetical protein
MAALTSQPASKTGVTLITGHPLYSSLVCYVVGFSAGSGGLDECFDFVSATALTAGGTSPVFGTLSGENGLLPAQVNANRVSLASSAALNVTGDVAIYWRGRVASANGTQHSLVSKTNNNNGTTNTPYDVNASNANGRVSVARSNAAGFRLHEATTGALTFDALQTTMILAPSDISVAPTIYTNGTAQTVSNTAGTGTGASTTNAVSLSFGWRSDNTSRQTGLFSLGVIFNALPTGADLTSFMANPWQMLDDGISPSSGARSIIRRRPAARLRG